MSNRDKETIQLLLQAYLNQTISEPELEILWEYLQNESYDEDFQDALKLVVPERTPTLDISIDSRHLYQKILAKKEKETPRINRRASYKQWMIAASISLLLIFSFLLSPFDFLNTKKESRHKNYTVIAQKNQPLTEVTLLRADGKKMSLDDKAEYNAKDLDISTKETISENTISTPGGKMYRLILPDGSKIWLNANTSVTFPSHFADESRKIEVVGEVYIEVQQALSPLDPNRKWPFYVKAADQLIEVKGTHFNVSAYSDEGETRTTLVEGHVVVHHKSGDHALNPGKQLLTKGDHVKPQIRQIDAEELIQWKNDVFVFDNEKLSDALKKVSRWYGTEFMINPKVSDRLIGGTIPKFTHIEETIHALQATGLFHYYVEKGGAYRIEK